MSSDLKYSLLMYIISFEIMYSMEAGNLPESILHLAPHDNLQPYLISQNVSPITASTWSFEHAALYLNNPLDMLKKWCFYLFASLPVLTSSSKL